jgi:hypothetical protein
VDPEPLSDILKSIWTDPAIDLAVLRNKASSLIWLYPLPVHFTPNGIATADPRTAMVTYFLKPNGFVEEEWT